MNDHDKLGKRITKVESGITPLYIYHGLTVLYEKVLENSTVTKYVYGAGKIVAKKGGTTTYFHQDHLFYCLSFNSTENN